MGNRGRYMKATQLHKTVHQLLAGGHTRDVPIWYDVLHQIPPTEILVRTRPVQLEEPDTKRRLPRNTYRPQKLIYEEDKLRTRFYQDHPWELARPRLILERHGTEPRHWDWSKGLRQPGLPLCGECVVQRQMWLMNNFVPPPAPQGGKQTTSVESQAESLVEGEPKPQKGLSENAAYDKARREFYALRQREEIATRVQREESQIAGGYFAPTYLELGEKMEDKAYKQWVKWAVKNVEQIKLERDARKSADFLLEEEEDDPLAPKADGEASDGDGSANETPEPVAETVVTRSR